MLPTVQAAVVDNNRRGAERGAALHTRDVRRVKPPPGQENPVREDNFVALRAEARPNGRSARVTKRFLEEEVVGRRIENRCAFIARKAGCMDNCGIRERELCLRWIDHPLTNGAEARIETFDAGLTIIALFVCDARWRTQLDLAFCAREAF
jgi:hypothetical protein